MLALIFAGGEGSRLRLGEKALVEVHGKSMISWVLDAFTAANCEPFVVTSYKTPYTRNWCRATGVEYLDTRGAGYVEDMNEAINLIGEEGPLFTSAADIPCLTQDIIEIIKTSHQNSGKPACSVWVPVRYCEKYGMQPRYTLEVEGCLATPCAVNILTGSQIDSEQDELCLLLDEPGLAFNINTREELKVLELEFEKIMGLRYETTKG